MRVSTPTPAFSAHKSSNQQNLEAIRNLEVDWYLPAPRSVVGMGTYATVYAAAPRRASNTLVAMKELRANAPKAVVDERAILEHLRGQPTDVPERGRKFCIGFLGSYEVPRSVERDQG